jgi:hypothetical protein
MRMSRFNTGDRPADITLRAAVIAATALLALAPISYYVEIVWFRVNDVAAGVPPSAPAVLLLMLGAGMMLPTLRRLRLSRKELLAVYCVVLVGGGFVHSMMVPFALSRNIAYYYAARANPIWESLFLESIPTWYAPSSLGIVEGYFRGGAATPWAAWFVPAGAELVYIILLSASLGSVVVLLRQQWISHEKLAFPLAQIPLEIIPGETKRQEVGRPSASSLFWIGAVAALALNFVNSLSLRVPTIPAIPLGPVPIVRWQKVGILAGIGDIELVLWPWLIGLAYLVPRELAFSVWFFWLVRLALHSIAVAHGATPQPASEWYGPEFPAPYFQCAGGGFALIGLVLWAARGHLRNAVRAAFTGRAGIDAGERACYRAAVTTFAVSVAGLLYYFHLANCRLGFAALLIGSIIASRLALARLRAEAGLGFIGFLELQDLIVPSTGVAAWRTPELIALTSRQWSFFGLSFAYVPGTLIESFKVADSARVDWRRLSVVTAGVCVLALLFGSAVWLGLMYRIGFMGTRVAFLYEAFSWQTLNAGGRVANWLTNPGMNRANPDAIIALGSGALVVVGLGMLRLRFWWWPFHPVGYIAANTWGAKWFYMPFLIGWACKSLVVRYGGLRLYRLTVPLAIGAIVGDSLNTAIWACIAVATGGRM